MTLTGSPPRRRKARLQGPIPISPLATSTMRLPLLLGRILRALVCFAAPRQVQERRAQLAALGQRSAGARDSTSGPSLPLERYAGTYRDAWYGDVTIALGAKGLVMRFSRSPSLVGDLIHWQHDAFLVRWRDRELRADAYATFALDHEGGIERLRMVPSSPAVDFSFDFQDLDLRPVATDSVTAH